MWTAPLQRLRLRFARADKPGHRHHQRGPARLEGRVAAPRLAFQMLDFERHPMEAVNDLVVTERGGCLFHAQKVAAMANDGKVAVKITSDGLMTHVMREDGTDLSRMITSVSFDHDAGSPARIRLELSFIPIEVRGRAEMIGPKGRAVKRIEYVDGTEDVFGE